MTTRVLLSGLFWLDATERAIKSAAQAILLGLGMSDTGIANAFEYDWKLAAGFALGGATLSYLTSIGTATVRGEATASAVNV